jgi:hypothetical protein
MNYTIDERNDLWKTQSNKQIIMQMTFRKKVDNVTEDSYLEKLENENRKVQVTGYSRQNEKILN